MKTLKPKTPVEKMAVDAGLDLADLRAEVQRQKKYCRDWRRQEFINTWKSLIAIKPIAKKVEYRPSFIFGGAATA